VLSRLLETVAALRPGAAVRIVENLPTPDEHPFLPRAPLDVRRLRLEEWEFAPAADRLMLSTAGVRAKQGTFRAFATARPIRRENFGQLVSPGAIVSSTAELAPGCFLEPMTVIASFARLGFSVSVNRGVTIGHHTVIGDFTTVSPGAHVAGHCRIGEGVAIGMGALVFDHIEVGAGSVIGGGSVVTRNVPSGVLAYGNPCKVVKEIAPA
jgi:sugar O-acyltransferase (sialic acid O-acetyltransferase NeuD family)